MTFLDIFDNMEIVQNKFRRNDNMGRQNTYVNPFILERADPFMIKADDDPLQDPCRHARIHTVEWTADGKPILNGREK